MRKTILAVFVFLLAISAVCQVPVTPIVNPKPQFFSSTGRVLAGGKLYFYAAGTDTPQSTYTSAAGSSANSNPVVLDSGGFPTSTEIWFSAASYKIVAKDANGVTQWTVDNVSSMGQLLSNFANEAHTWPELQDFTTGISAGVVTGPLTGDVTSTGTSTFKNINNRTYVSHVEGGDACAEINACLVSLPAGKGTCDASIFAGTSQTCASNMFAGYTGTGGQLVLPVFTLTTTAKQTQPPQMAVIGSGPGNPVGTFIKADSTFPVNTPVWEASNGGTADHAARLENVFIDCNGVTNGIGYQSTDINEKSGPINVAVGNCSKYGINIDASVNVGTGPAQTYTMRDIEVYPNEFGTSSTIGVRLVGNSGNGPASIENVTVAGQTGHEIGAAFLFAAIANGAGVGLHAEHAATGFQIGDAILGAVNNLTLINISGTPTVTDVALISSGSQNVNLIGVDGTGATNTIRDIQNSKTITASSVGAYHTGDGVTQTVITSDTSTTNVIGSMVMLGGFNANDNDLSNVNSMILRNVNFAALGTPVNGTQKYCSDCTIASPCASGGTGAFAKRINGAWVCN